MATGTRIYLVSDGSTENLVDATSPAAAVRFVAGNNRYSVEMARPADVARLMATGVRVQHAKPAQQTLGDAA